MRFFLFILFVIGIAFSPRGIVCAEDGTRGITVDPAFQEIVLGQKDAQTDFFVSITNTTEMAVTLRITVFDFGSLDESGGVAFLGATNDLGRKYAIASWIRPEKDVFILSPNETKKILVTIENREGLSPGGHYGALTFKTEKSTEGDTAENTEETISINQLFSTLLFVKKVGGEIYGLDLKKSEYKNNFVQFQSVLRLRFQNVGNVHIVPRGMATVSDPFGRIVAKGIINEESALILPETFRVYPVRFRTLAISFVPGRYTMEIAYRYDGKEDLSIASFQFNFIPLPAILAFLVCIIVGWRYMMRRSFFFRR